MRREEQITLGNRQLKFTNSKMNFWHIFSALLAKASVNQQCTFKRTCKVVNLIARRVYCFFRFRVYINVYIFPSFKKKKIIFFPVNGWPRPPQPLPWLRHCSKSIEQFEATKLQMEVENKRLMTELADMKRAFTDKSEQVF